MNRTPVAQALFFFNHPTLSRWIHSLFMSCKPWKAKNHPESSSAPSTKPGSCQMLAGGISCVRGQGLPHCSLSGGSEEQAVLLFIVSLSGWGQMWVSSRSCGSRQRWVHRWVQNVRDVNTEKKTGNPKNKQNKKHHATATGFYSCWFLAPWLLPAGRVLHSGENQLFLEEYKPGENMVPGTHLPHSWSILRRKRQLQEAEDPSPFLCASQAFSVLFHIESLVSQTTGHWIWK